MSYYAHPTALVESDDIGEGTRIWHFAHIRQGAHLGSNCNLGKGVYVDTGVRVGNNVKVQNFVSLYHGVEVEDEVFIGPSVTFTNDLYPRAFIWSENRVVPTRVLKGASIGANATIVCGVTIGRYAMVAAGSVVTRDVPGFALVMGAPAEVKGYVCYCGRPLDSSESISASSEGIVDLPSESKPLVFRCRSCGREVEIPSPEEAKP